MPSFPSDENKASASSSPPASQRGQALQRESQSPCGRRFGGLDVFGQSARNTFNHVAELSAPGSSAERRQFAKKWGRAATRAAPATDPDAILQTCQIARLIAPEADIPFSIGAREGHASRVVSASEILALRSEPTLLKPSSRAAALIRSSSVAPALSSCAIFSAASIS